MLAGPRQGRYTPAQHAQILFKSNQVEGLAWPDTQIAGALNAGTATVERIRPRFVEGGLAAALRPRAPAAAVVTGCRLPSHAPALGNQPQMPITPPRGRLGPRAWHGARARGTITAVTAS